MLESSVDALTIWYCSNLKGINSAIKISNNPGSIHSFPMLEHILKTSLKLSNVIIFLFTQSNTLSLNSLFLSVSPPLNTRREF